MPRGVVTGLILLAIAALAGIGIYDTLQGTHRPMGLCVAVLAFGIVSSIEVNRMLRRPTYRTKASRRLRLEAVARAEHERETRVKPLGSRGPERRRRARHRGVGKPDVLVQIIFFLVVLVYLTGWFGVVPAIAIYVGWVALFWLLRRLRRRRPTPRADAVRLARVFATDEELEREPVKPRIVSQPRSATRTPVG